MPTDRRRPNADQPSRPDRTQGRAAVPRDRGGAPPPNSLPSPNPVLAPPAQSYPRPYPGPPAPGSAPPGPPGPPGPPPRQRKGPGGRPPSHRPRGRTLTFVRRWGLVLVLLVGLGAAARFVPGSPFKAASGAAPGPSATGSTAKAQPTPTPTPTPSPTPPPPPQLRFRNTTVNVNADGLYAWALMDRRTGEIWGSPTMTATTWPASMIKGWLSADYLRRIGEKGLKPTSAQLAEVDRVIRDSDNDAAEDLYERNGGTAGIKRLITICKLTDTTASGKGWSFTNISARDTVRMADCIADGPATGPAYTAWLLNEMATVREGDWGIREALPQAEQTTVSIKNGWLNYTDDNMWHINCMAVSDTWAMAVLQRYKGTGKYNSDFLHGQQICQETATQLLNPDYVQG